MFIKNNCYIISILDWNPLSLRLKNPTTRATEESVHVAVGVVDRHTEDQFFYAVCFNWGPWFRFSNPLCSDFFFHTKLKTLWNQAATMPRACVEQGEWVAVFAKLTSDNCAAVSAVYTSWFVVPTFLPPSDLKIINYNLYTFPFSSYLRKIIPKIRIRISNSKLWII